MKFKATCINSIAVSEKCTGCFIEQIDLRLDYDRDGLSISFFPAPGLGEVGISLQRVRYFSLDKPPELSGSFVDSIKATDSPACWR
jgi:hypothetical protein